jgi:hypothetical protein
MADAPNPGERRLSHPPSDRYRVNEPPASPVPDPGASRARGVAVATIAGLVGAGAITGLGGIVTVTAGLLVVAAGTGWAVATGLRLGAGGQLSRRGRSRLAPTVALVAIALGQAGLWLLARAQGGVLAPFDFLWEVYGVLVPLEFAIAAAVAWIAAR